MRIEPHELYDQVAEDASALVIKRYSTSFSLAARILAEPVRTRVCNIYALVRVADEIVDAPRPNGEHADRVRLLDTLQAEVYEALNTGHSANLVVHAFARTARLCHIGRDLVDPFFSSMRTDLFRTEHDRESFDTYVYGSAEVVGLMCLRAFLADQREGARQFDELSDGARRLGAAFQKINFLRDLGDDTAELGRKYLPGLHPDRFDETVRDELLDEIEADLAAAAAVIPRLPDRSRRAVCAAHALFAELARRLRTASPQRIRTERISVPSRTKARVIARAVAVGVS